MTEQCLRSQNTEKRNPLLIDSPIKAQLNVVMVCIALTI